MSLVSFMSESMSDESLMFNPLANIVRSIIADANGAMFDPSDMTTLYQDAAGTTPVTAVEQPVGKILDKSGKGNHATQSVTAYRPTLSARKNLLLATEALATQSVTSIAAQYTLSFSGTGSVTLSGTATGTLTGTGADRVSLTFTPTAGTLTLTVSGSVTKAQVELGAVAGPYQRVNTSTDYDTDERYFPKYLRFDGVDDYLNLPYMGLYAGGACSIIAAQTAYIQADDAYLISECSNSSGTPQYCPIRQIFGNGLVDSIVVTDTGSWVIDTNGWMWDGVPSITIRSCVDSGDRIKSFKNTEKKDDDFHTRSGTLTLNNTTIGAIVGLSARLFMKMNLHSLIITKSALSDAQRIQCERLLARKAGVQL